MPFRFSKFRILMTSSLALKYTIIWISVCMYLSKWKRRTYRLTCAHFLKKLRALDMLYRICFEYCVPILSHFWWKPVCWELFEVSGSSHCSVDPTGQWLLPKNLNSSQQTNFRQKWLKIGTQYSKHILYNISESHNFFKKSAHVNLHSTNNIHTLKIYFSNR